jgi:hypothetical protein
MRMPSSAVVHQPVARHHQRPHRTDASLVPHGNLPWQRLGSSERTDTEHARQATDGVTSDQQRGDAGYQRGFPGTALEGSLNRISK